MSLFSAPDRKEYIGWNATINPASTAANSWRGAISRTVRKAKTAARAPISADIRRMPSN
jgi:hypothetical protein